MFTGGTGGSGGMTSSTEKCQSESGCVSGIPKSPSHLPRLNLKTDDLSSDESTPPSPTLPHPTPILSFSGTNVSSAITQLQARYHSSMASNTTVTGYLGTPLPPTPGRAISSDQDAANTHEDMSSLSEQAWDPYQVISKSFWNIKKN